MDLLEKIKDFAAKAHEGQTRKYKEEPYINHPVRVMELCREHTDNQPILAAALLHDVLEDTEVTSNELKAFLHTMMDDKDAEQTFCIVNDLTDIYTKANYPMWNRRKRKTEEANRLEGTSAESQTVRYADIIDNTVGMAKYNQDDFAEKFLKECRSLLKRITKGNKELYMRAVNTVDENLSANKSAAVKQQK